MEKTFKAKGKPYKVPRSATFKGSTKKGSGTSHQTFNKGSKKKK